MAPSSSISPPWSELPPEILGLVMARLAADDHARFRAVCRSWHSAMRHEHVPRDLFPRIVRGDGKPFFVTSTDASVDIDKVRCIGSTNDWIAIDYTQDDETHTYFLCNTTSGAIVPLPELDDVIGRVTEEFRVFKVHMRSTPDDVIAIMTNNWNYPLMLVRPGKGLWSPQPRTTPFVRIIDVAFLGDQLYGVTRADNNTPLDVDGLGLVSLDISFDDDGVPMVTNVKRIIRLDNESDDWGIIDNTDDDDDDDDSNDDEEKTDDDADDEGESQDNDNDEEEDKNDNDLDDEINGDDLDESRNKTGDGMILEAIHITDDEDVQEEPRDLIATLWYFGESCGKMIMVRRELQLPYYAIRYTRSVKVFEVDINTGTWMPVSDGLCGQSLFVSKPFCKSMPAGGEIAKDAIYFVDSGEVFNMRSHTITPPQGLIDFRLSTWTFPMELMV
jgi:hypothetical protein